MEWVENQGVPDLNATWMASMARDSFMVAVWQFHNPSSDTAVAALVFGDYQQEAPSTRKKMCRSFPSMKQCFHPFNSWQQANAQTVKWVKWKWTLHHKILEVVLGCFLFRQNVWLGRIVIICFIGKAGPQSRKGTGTDMSLATLNILVESDLRLICYEKEGWWMFYINIRGWTADIKQSVTCQLRGHPGENDDHNIKPN